MEIKFKIEIEKGDEVLISGSDIEERVGVLFDTALGENTILRTKYEGKDSVVAIQLPDIPGIEKIAGEILSVREADSNIKLGSVTVTKEVPIIFVNAWKKDITLGEAKAVIEKAQKELEGVAGELAQKLR